MSARHDRRRRDLARSARPTLEGLERRELLFATEGGLWAHPGRITFSFVPDGTSVGGTPSSLFQSMNSNPNAANWVAAFCNAAVIWQQVTGINLEPVPDDGAALGLGSRPAGRPQPRRHPHRRRPMSPSTLATAYAPAADQRRRPGRRHRLQHHRALDDQRQQQRRLRPGDGRHPRAGPRPRPGPLDAEQRRHVRLLQYHEAGADRRRHPRHPVALRGAARRPLLQPAGRRRTTSPDSSIPRASSRRSCPGRSGRRCGTTATGSTCRRRRTPRAR